MTTRYGMERSSPKKKDYAEERPRSKNAVQARTAEPFEPIRPMSGPMKDALERIAEYRASGKSWRPHE